MRHGVGPGFGFGAPPGTGPRLIAHGEPQGRMAEPIDGAEAADFVAERLGRALLGDGDDLQAA